MNDEQLKILNEELNEIKKREVRLNAAIIKKREIESIRSWIKYTTSASGSVQCLVGGSGMPIRKEVARAKILEALEIEHQMLLQEYEDI